MSTDRRASEILALFDVAAGEYRFPDVGHVYSYAVDVRLHALSDGTRWALIVELVGYNPRAADLIDVLHFFGNCLTHGAQGFDNDGFLGRIENLGDLVDDEEGYVGGVPFRIRGQLIAPAEAVAGEEIWDTCRRLIPQHRDLLLADEQEWRARVPSDLPRVLVLDAWHQPDLYETQPSASRTFQMLAEVLATADTSRYAPSAEPNTHWSNWPESGSL